MQIMARRDHIEEKTPNYKKVSQNFKKFLGFQAFFLKPSITDISNELFLEWIKEEHYSTQRSYPVLRSIHCYASIY